MKTLLAVAREVLADLVKLNLPVTGAATAAALVGYAQVFSVELPSAEVLAASLALFGLVLAYIQKLRARVKA